MDARIAFKFGLLSKLAAEGLSTEQMVARVRAVRQKLAFDPMGNLASAGSNLLQGAAGLGQTGLAAALVAPPLAGAALGGSAGYFLNSADDQDANEVKQRELMTELKRLTAQARQNRVAKSHRRMLESAGGRRSWGS